MNDLSIIMVTADCLADVWPITATLFERHWPDRPTMYWCHNTHPVPLGATPIPCQPRSDYSGWICNLRTALQVVTEPFVINWTEDVWPLSRVQTDLVEHCLGIMQANPDVVATSLSHYYHSPSSGIAHDDKTVILPHGTPLRIAALPSLWRKDVLEKVLETFITPNIFERDVSAAVDLAFPQSRVLLTTSPIFTICDNAISEGHWKTCALRHAEKEGLLHLLQVNPRGMSTYPSKYPDGNH